jgi:dynein heavy chain
LLQNYSRKNKIPIDKVTFRTEVVRNDFKAKNYESNETIIYGMFMEGASFDYEDMIMTESPPRVLFLENIKMKLISFD